MIARVLHAWEAWLRLALCIHLAQQFLKLWKLGHVAPAAYRRWNDSRTSWREWREMKTGNETKTNCNTLTHASELKTPRWKCSSAALKMESDVSQAEKKSPREHIEIRRCRKRKWHVIRRSQQAWASHALGCATKLALPEANFSDLHVFECRSVGVRKQNTSTACFNVGINAETTYVSTFGDCNIQVKINSYIWALGVLISPRADTII